MTVIWDIVKKVKNDPFDLHIKINEVADLLYLRYPEVGLDVFGNKDLAYDRFFSRIASEVAQSIIEVSS